MSVQKPNRHFVKAFQIKHFQGIADSGRVQLAPGAPWVFITGENGFGKTSVLQALAVGLSGRNIRKGETVTNLAEGSVFLIETGDKKFTGKSGSQGFPSVFCYGSSRLNLAAEDRYASNPIYSLFETNSYLINIGQHLASWYHKRNEYDEFHHKFTVVKDALVRLLGIYDIEVDKDDNVTYIDQDQEGSKFPPVTFGQLASGYRNLIALVGDMVVRLFKGQPQAYRLSDLTGIVIIDEFDLHLHPKWQYRLPGLLSRIFPQVQFIVSTHSPVPLLGVPEGSTFLKVTCNAEDSITIQNLDYVEVRNLTPNTVLSSPIFDFDKLIPESNIETAEVRTEVHHRDSTKVYFQRTSPTNGTRDGVHFGRVLCD
jgi:predicted ATPase